MRVLTLVCLALAGCFGPNVADGSLLCQVGDECPPSMFCRLDCGRRCFFSPSGTCGEDAAVPDSPVDTPLPLDAPIGAPDVPVIVPPDGPIVVMPDVPVIVPPDGPVVIMPDVPIITIPDAPIMTADACIMLLPVDDAGITICTAIKK